jgi:imidazolonepropionase
MATMVAGAAPYGNMKNAALAVKGEHIAWIGPAVEAHTRAAAQNLSVQDVQGLWMTPGLIDCHTHLVYGGNRVEEFEQRLCGVSYEDIARAGGGIQSTVQATRAASHLELFTSAAVRAERLMSEGVTTIEVKSGYGLELGSERRLLEVARDLGLELPLSIKKTFLGLHALPREFAADRQDFVDRVTGPGWNRWCRQGWWMRSMRFAKPLHFRWRRRSVYCRRRSSWGCARMCMRVS